MFLTRPPNQPPAVNGGLLDTINVDRLMTKAEYKVQNWFEFYESGFSAFEQMALRKVRSNLDRLFDKSLTDLIRGIRNNKDNEARYIASCIEEIKVELRQDSIYIKANAIEKLAYLQMLGYDISWASFNIIEVMASTKYTEKRIGYLAAAQSFHDETDVLMLTTNLIRKDLNSAHMYESGVALGGLACFITPDLARDLAADVVNLLSSSRAYTRKRAVLLLYKVFLKYPDSLRPTFPRLKEKLEDPDPGVQSAAVNVICELARKIPKNYLTLAPVFFNLMQTSSNNWMLIKIIKLFGALVPLEPRLGKKLLEPLTTLINSTSAMSLLYECINTVIAVLITISNNSTADHTASIQLCVQKLGVLIEDSDQNLKYLGLLAMGKILETHPKAVQAHKDIVLRCLDDKDESIRLRSLDLLYGMISKKNIMEIVKKLMEHVESAEGSYYRDELLSRIIGICSYNNYLYITNFEWYISVLVELTKVEGTKHGAKIAEQIQDVTVRVESIRHFAVSQMALLVENANLLLAGSAQQRSNICEVLLAAAWICGEYSQHLQNVQSVLESMLRAKPSLMPGHILSVYVQNFGKLYSVLLTEAEKEDDWDAIESLDNLMLSKLPEFEVAEHLEAQERACNLMCLLRIAEDIHHKREKIGDEFVTLYEGELNPVNPKAQKSVRIPDGLDLDMWIGDPWEETPEESSDSEIEATFGQPQLRSEFASFGSYVQYESEEETPQPKETKKKKTSKPHEPSAEDIEKRRKQREQEIENNPFYVKGTATVPKRPTKFVTMESQYTAEVVDIQSPLEIPGVVGLARYTEQQDSTLTWKRAKEEKVKKPKKGKKGKKRRTVSTSSEEEVNIVHKVNRADGEMPEDARPLDEEIHIDAIGLSDEFKALDVNLDEPLKPEEVIRGPQAYTRIHPATRPTGPLVPRPPTIDSYANNGVSNRVITEEPKKMKKTSKKKPETEKKKKKSKKTDENGDFSMDQWLDAAPSTVSVGKAVDSLKTEKKKKKKKHLSPSRELYEEASGVCTPSNPNIDISPKLSMQALGPVKLGTNADLVVDYETQVLASKSDNLKVTLTIKNTGSKLIKNVEINCIDTLCAKLKRTTENGVKLSGELSPEAVETFTLSFTISGNTMATQQLRGAIVYFTKDDEGSSDGKLDFKLPLRPTTFVSPTPITKDGYSQLLTGEDVDFSSSIQFQSDLSFKDLINRVTNLGHFSVVEEVSSAASLHGVFVSGEPICVLMKKKGDQISIDGKSGAQELVDAVVQDLRLICQK